MLERVEKTFFSLLRFELGAKLSEEEKSILKPELLQQLFVFSKRFDLAHLICDALDKNGFLQDNSDIKEQFFKERNIAVYRYAKMQYEFNAICEVFRDSKISFIPIKGAIIRQYYPEPWMRTSCDIDILVNDAQIEYAANCLVDLLGYKKATKKDINALSLYAPSGVHLELHYDLTEGEKYGNAVLKNLWSNLHLNEDCNGYYLMNNEFFYFYHILHMVKHFENGGCGIRPFLDLWLLDNKLQYDRFACDDLLRKASIIKFADSVRKLAKVWFKPQKYDDLSWRIKEYIVAGGSYGTTKNRVITQQVKSGNKFRYIYSRIFISKKELAIKYPILHNFPYFAPFCHIIRWMKPLINKKSRKKSFGELRQASTITKYANTNMGNLISDLELL